MSNLRRMMMAARSGSDNDNVVLPPEYQKVAYLESNGTQGIHTGLKMGELDEYQIDLSWIRRTTSYQKRMFGGYAWSQSLCYITVGYTNSGTTALLRYDVYGISVKQEWSGDYITRKKVVVSPAKGVFIDEKKINDSYSQNVRPPRTPYLCLFGRGSETQGQIAEFGEGRIHSFKWLDAEGNKIMHMAPCYRKEDGKPGMYDVVTETFFTNTGTGEFIVGEDVNG